MLYVLTYFISPFPKTLVLKHFVMCYHIFWVWLGGVSSDQHTRCAYLSGRLNVLTFQPRVYAMPLYRRTPKDSVYAMPRARFLKKITPDTERPCICNAPVPPDTERPCICNAPRSLPEKIHTRHRKTVYMQCPCTAGHRKTVYMQCPALAS